MRKLLLNAGALSLALVASLGLATSQPAFAADDNATSDVEYCTALVPILQDQNPDLKGLSLGRCVSYFRADDVAGLCKYLKDFEILELVGFTTQGQCVSTLRKIL